MFVPFIGHKKFSSFHTLSLFLLLLIPWYRDRRVERQSNIYKPLGISDVSDKWSYFELLYTNICCTSIRKDGREFRVLQYTVYSIQTSSESHNFGSRLLGHIVCINLI